MRTLALLACACAAAPLQEPFAWLHDTLPGRPEPSSPDPLVATRWASSVNTSALQIYAAAPSRAFGTAGVDGAETLVGGNGSCTIPPNATLTLDFGVERAGWFEFRVAAPVDGLIAAISEYSYPWTGKSQAPVAYDDNWYRLETNDELYEGVRFAFLTAAGAAVEVLEARCVARARPANYTGRFASSDDVLERLWWTGAYAARLNMNADDFGSILIDRGDRVSIQGDGHPTMAAAEAALGAPPTWALVAIMLNKTDSGCDGCHVVDDDLMSYPVLWTMSCNDYFWASGDVESYAAFAPDAATILDDALATFLQDPPVEFMGWDDRLDNGFCGHCTPETQVAFAALLIRAAADFADALAFVSEEALPGASKLSARFGAAAANATALLRASTPAYGVHSAAYALNAPDVVLPSEAAGVVDALLRDATTACSWSPFNSYWILQALGNAGFGELALSHAALCWGGALNLTNGCFPELYSPEWTAFLDPGAKLPTKPSLCHPWSSGVTPWLTRVGAGLRPLAPGYSTTLAAPLLASCAGFVAGEVAAPAGPVRARAACADGAFEVNASAPGRVVVALRRTLGDGCNLTKATADGAPAPLLDAAAANATAAVRPLEARGLAFVVGRRVVGRYACPATPATPDAFGPPIYAASVAPLDRRTKGRWPGAYGGAGRVLFLGAGDDARLPAWVANVTTYKNEPTRTGYAANQTRDPEALLCSDETCDSRVLGSLGEGCHDGCQGTVLDVVLTEDAPATARVSAYLVDVPPGSDRMEGAPLLPFPAPGVSTVLRAMDLETGSLVASEAACLVSNFTGGAYLSLGYAKSLRLRFMPVYGSARVSALFFDA